jgi:glycosyltransferase involved in cell wall biosynthesis
VTGSVYAEVLKSWGATSFILHDPLELKAAAVSVENERLIFVCPAGWAHDEPLHELVEAFDGLPHQLLITGRQKYLLDLPMNVVSTGFLSDSEFEQHLSGCHSIISLTTREETMQRGGYEALERGKPLLTSDTRILREYFGQAAVYCGAEAVSIRAAVEEVARNYEALVASMHNLQIPAQAGDEVALEAVRRYVNG